jgi:putative CocE/NonD family hydrolase
MRLLAWMLHVSGWYDDVLVGTTENFINMTTRAQEPNARRNQWLVIGPWPHATNCCTELAGIDFGPRALIDYDTLQVRFFDRFLNERQNGFESDPRVKIFVMGANVWRDENEWPLARTQYTKYYLHSGGSANTLEGDGALSTTLPGNEKAGRYSTIRRIRCRSSASRTTRKSALQMTTGPSSASTACSCTAHRNCSRMSRCAARSKRFCMPPRRQRTPTSWRG